MAAELRRALCGAMLLLLGVPAAFAEVERIEITQREPFAGGKRFGTVGAYEKIVGLLHYAVDPDHPANARVVDLGRAPREADGLVRFAGEFMVLRPIDPARGNRRLLYEVGNRGGVGMLGFFNDAEWNNRPSSVADAGSGFLFAQGYTLAWSAWNWDVLDGDGRMQIDLPLTLGDDGEPITGPVTAEITVKQRVDSQPVAWGNSRGYPAVLVAQPEAKLTVRATQRDPRRKIPRDQWQFARVEDGQTVPDPTHIALDGGFEPGLLYEVVYEATNARVVGLGLAAIRDAISFFRFTVDESNPIAGTVDHALIFGISQSGRVINHMLLEAFHLDELDRMVFDAALIHVGGSGKGGFNHRFAQTTRHGSPHEDHQYPADFFPFTTVPQKDPLTGARDSLLARAVSARAVPKLFFTNTSGEYWTRSASLLHTDVDGLTDVPLDANARLYVFAGAQHGNWLVSHRAWFENCINPLDHRPAMRALLLKLDAWAVRGEAPPDSVYPKLADDTLGALEIYRVRFPEVPEMRLPTVNLRPPRLDLGQRWVTDRIIDRAPPGLDRPFETRVPMPDRDGIDLGGIRMPAAAVPLGTYTGWNLRQHRFGAGDQIDRWVGTFVPFDWDLETRDQTKDPRPSVTERYPSLADYVGAVREAAAALEARGFLLAIETPAIVARAGAFYTRIKNRDTSSLSCEYLAPAG